MDKVIVLNADYSFLNVVPLPKAITMMAKGKVQVLKATDKIIRNFEGTCAWAAPMVVKLVKFVRAVFKNKVPFNKKNVCIRDGFECQYCGTKTEKLTLDHVVPKCHGGKRVFENIVAACFTCNQTKGDKLPREIGMFPKNRPVQPTIMEFLMIKSKIFGIRQSLIDLGIY